MLLTSNLNKSFLPVFDQQNEIEFTQRKIYQQCFNAEAACLVSSYTPFNTNTDIKQNNILTICVLKFTSNKLKSILYKIFIKSIFAAINHVLCAISPTIINKFQFKTGLSTTFCYTEAEAILAAFPCKI